jgi:hypothetical protein
MYNYLSENIYQPRKTRKREAIPVFVREGIFIDEGDQP